ncbi:MAG: protein kinase [Planctomycetes bacterium]|nr:protein kinase [Planctomycetota bacterium]
MRESETLPRGILIHDRFRLGALRARGGMATIYEGTEIPTDRHVAIKFLRTDLAKNPDMVGMFRAEAAIVTKLDHPNLIRGLASGTFGASHYIVMEFVSGPTLRERLKWGQPERDEAMSILKQAAAALDHAHDRGVVHRDIKPDNFILEKSVLKLSDFGIAQITRKGPVTKDSSALGGTVIYSAPEQFTEGAIIDRRADVYALGIVAYEMFTGRTPFTGYKPASSFSHRVPRAADTVLERAFNENPAARYPSASAFVLALEAAFIAFAPDSTPAPRLEMATPPHPMKPVPREPAPESPPGANPPPEESGSAWSILAWVLLVGAVVAVGILAARAMGIGPFARQASGALKAPPRLRASLPRPSLPVPLPGVVGKFPHDKAEPPAPALLLEDRFTVSLGDSGNPNDLEVRTVSLESRVKRTCENTWGDAVHEFVEGEAFGGALLFDAALPYPQPRVTSSEFRYTAGHPVHLFLELENPKATLDLDLAAGRGTIVRDEGNPQTGTCEYRASK